MKSSPAILMRQALAVVAAAVLAVPAAALAQPRQSNDADAAEVRQYRLTMEKVRALAKVYEALAVQQQKDPKLRALEAKRKELEKLLEKDNPSAADERRAEQLEREIEAAEDAMPGIMDDQDATLADMAASVERSPLLGPAVRSAGMKPREFVVLQIALWQAMTAHAFQKSGQARELPKGISPENVRFVAKHEAELQAIQQQMEAIGGGR